MQPPLAELKEQRTRADIVLFSLSHRMRRNFGGVRCVSPVVIRNQKPSMQNEAPTRRGRGLTNWWSNLSRGSGDAPRTKPPDHGGDDASSRPRHSTSVKSLGSSLFPEPRLKAVTK